jgi:hypothetical protein
VADVIDSISNGRKVSCPDCGDVFEDIDPQVAIAILNNHIKRKHGDAR